MKPIQCDSENRALLAERYALGGMQKKEKQAFEAHLATCTLCTKQLQENQKIVNKLKDAAAEAGWSEKDVAKIDRLYARAGLARSINWWLTLKIALLLMAFVIVPFFWWANQDATKMALLVSLQRESSLLAGETDLSGQLQPLFELHKNGRDEEVVAAGRAVLPQIAETDERATLERLLGLSFLFTDQPDSALPHLQKAQLTGNPYAEQKSHYYAAQAHLLMANKLGAIAALKHAEKIQSDFTEKVVSLRDQINNL